MPRHATRIAYFPLFSAEFGDVSNLPTIVAPLPSGCIGRERPSCGGLQIPRIAVRVAWTKAAVSGWGVRVGEVPICPSSESLEIIWALGARGVGGLTAIGLKSDLPERSVL